jgi:hypothetical protein
MPPPGGKGSAQQNKNTPKLQLNYFKTHTAMFMSLLLLSKNLFLSKFGMRWAMLSLMLLWMSGLMAQPTARCKPSITLQLDQNGFATLSPLDVDNGSTGASSISITSVTLGGGSPNLTYSCASLSGRDTVSLIVQDASGNIRTCLSVVTVLDTIRPTSRCNNITVNVTAAMTVNVLADNLAGANFSDNCSPSGIYRFSSGSNTRTYTIADLGLDTVTVFYSDVSGNTSSCLALVHVLDASSPRGSRNLDSLGLVKIRNHFNHPVLNSLWPPLGMPISQWSGVTMGATGNQRVIALNLSNLGLTGSFPGQIMSGNDTLGMLSTIDLSGNNLTTFTGPLSRDVHPMFRRLVLSGNDLIINQNGALDTLLKGLVGIEDLIISNGIDSVAPNVTLGLYMPNHPFLENLNLSDNELQRLLIDFDFLTSSQLVEIRLNNNRLRQLSLANRSGRPIRFDSLEVLNLSQNFLAQMSLPLAPRLGTLDLSDNLLREFNYSALGNATANLPYPYLRNLSVSNNLLDFYELSKLALRAGLEYNISQLSGYANRSGLVPPASFSFDYAPQKPLGVGGVRRRPVGDSIIFRSDIRHPDSAALADLGFTSVFPMNHRFNTTKWYRKLNLLGVDVLVALDSSAVGFSILPEHIAAPSLSLRGNTLSGNQTLGSLLIQNLSISGHDGYFYHAEAYNRAFPLFYSVGGLKTKPKRTIVGDCFDSLGLPIRCQEMVVQYRPSISPNDRERLREELGVEVLDTCTCGNVEWWALSDTMNMLELEQDGRGTRSSTSTAQNKPQLLSASTNYNLLNAASLLADRNPGAPTGSSNPNATLVAIIDAGLDTDHPEIRNRVWINSGEIPGNDLNDDNNCLTDDAYGYNFLDLDRRGQPYDDHGHGTQVAGIIAGRSLPNVMPVDTNALDSLAILPLKYTNKAGEGTTFHATCAIYYAADFNDNGKRVRVINASWGYYGEPSGVLEEALRYADSACHILVVTSAGNEGIDNDTIGHYPSDYRLGNLLSVAALDNGNGTVERLAGYSNFGDSSVHLAAPGRYNTPTSIVGNNIAARLNTDGTSFAAASVSRAAGILFHLYPDASPQAVRQALIEGVDILSSGDSSKLLSRGRLNLAKATQVLGRMTAQDRRSCSPGLIASFVAGEQNQTLAAKLYPNPFTQQLRLEWVQALEQEVRWELFSSEGHLLLHGQIQAGQQQQELQLQQLPAGFYWLRYGNSQGQYSAKIVKLP